MNVKTIVLVVVVIIVLALAADAFFIVDSRERAILLQFGAVVRDDVEPGLNWKIPIAQEARKFDGRILTLDAEPARYYTVDQQPLQVDWFAKWRISSVKDFYTATAGSKDRANSLLTARVDEGLRNEIGTRDQHEVVSGERDLLMQQLSAELNVKMTQAIGISVIDIRVKKIDLPPEISDAVFERMNSEREITARQRRSTGDELARGIRADAERQKEVLEAEAYRDAELIRGDGDARATKIYADAYGQDPDFYEFYRSLDAYTTAFGEESGTLLVIDPSSDFFKYLENEEGD